jgi:hypothetical protein
MESNKEKSLDSGQTEVQLLDHRSSGSRLPPIQRITDGDCHGEGDSPNWEENERLPSPFPGRQRYVISIGKFSRLNGWDADNTDIDHEFDNFKENVFLRWLGCFEQYPDSSFKEICLLMYESLTKKNFKGQLTDNQIDFFRMNALRKVAKRSKAKAPEVVVQNELRKWITFAENEEIKASVRRSREDLEQSKVPLHHGSPRSRRRRDDDDVDEDEEGEVGEVKSKQPSRDYADEEEEEEGEVSPRGSSIPNFSSSAASDAWHAAQAAAKAEERSRKSTKLPQHLLPYAREVQTLGRKLVEWWLNLYNSDRERFSDEKQTNLEQFAIDRTKEWDQLIDPDTGAHFILRTHSEEYMRRRLVERDFVADFREYDIGGRYIDQDEKDRQKGERWRRESEKARSKSPPSVQDREERQGASRRSPERKRSNSPQPAQGREVQRVRRSSGSPRRGGRRSSTPPSDSSSSSDDESDDSSHSNSQGGSSEDSVESGQSSRSARKKRASRAKGRARNSPKRSSKGSSRRRSPSKSRSPSRGRGDGGGSATLASNLTSAMTQAVIAGVNAMQAKPVTVRAPQARWAHGGDFRGTLIAFSKQVASADWLTPEERHQLIDAKNVKVIQTGIDDFTGESRDQRKLHWLDTSYNRETWKTMSHEQFFKLLSVIFEVSLPNYPLDSHRVDNHTAAIEDRWGSATMPEHIGPDFYQWMVDTWEKCGPYSAAQFCDVFENAKSAAERAQQDKDWADKKVGAVEPPSMAKRQEAQKLFNTMARAMLRRAAIRGDPHGKVLLRMLFTACFDPGNTAVPTLWLLCDFFRALKEAYAAERELGRKNYAIGLAFTNGVFTRDDFAALSREGNCLDATSPKPSKQSGGGGGVVNTGRPKGESRRNSGGKPWETQNKGGRAAGAAKPKIEPTSQDSQTATATMSEQSRSLEHRHLCDNCNSYHKGACRRPPRAEAPVPEKRKFTDEETAKWQKRQEKRAKREKETEKSDSAQGEPGSDHPSPWRRWEEPTDCLFSCEECKVDACLLHNRAPVMLSVVDQDLATAAEESRSRKRARSSRPSLDLAANPSPGNDSAGEHSISTTARLDTGCSLRNFIRQDLAEKLISLGSKVVAVEGGIRGRFHDEPKRVYNRALILKYGFWNAILQTKNTIVIKAVIMQALDVPLIIGIHTIGENGLGCLQKPELCHPMCGHSRESATIPSLTRPSVQSTGVSADSHDFPLPSAREEEGQSAACVKELGLQMRRSAPQGDLGIAAPAFQSEVGKTSATVSALQETAGETVAVVEGHSKSTEPLPGLASRPHGVGGLISHRGGTSKWEECELCQVRSSSRDLFGSGADSESDGEKPPDNIADLLPSVTAGGKMGESVSEMIKQIIFEGESEQQERLRNLCTEFGDIFATSVRNVPAAVPAMSLTVDAEKFRKTAGKSKSPRPQSQEKLAELKRMITELLRLGVVTTSTADTVSQVLLVVKKGTTKLRFCIDYRALNEATSLSEAWPIPNIRELLERLGQKRPKFFGVMDLTSGYHQAPLSKSARKWTAFITAFGCFEWTRVPMGLKGAPSYFSRVMMNNLRDLLMKAVEVYLDDFIVFGEDFDEFIFNLEQVFLNFRRSGITLNPAKCRFGLQKVEYVGHTIDSEGLHFTRSKIDSILDFPKPTTKGAMKTFLGMVNHMHAHIKNLSQTEVPLTRLIGEGYSKAKRKHVLVWDAESEAAYEHIKRDVDMLPKLFFEDPSMPIYVQTDASYYGIGAYMFQLAPDKSERPICFLSKTLTKDQRRWGIPDKEAYGIFYAVKRWNHLLRDRHFVLQTDHKNLSYINYEGTAKVRRWKMLLQEYNFEIEYIKGEDNPVADSFSRNCAIEEDFDDDLKVFEEDFERSVDGEYHAFIEDEGHAPYDYEFGEEYNDFREYMEEYYAFAQAEPIPAKIRDEIMKVHNSFVGHMGVRRTEERLRAAGVSLKYARGWIERFIAECPFCQKQSYKTSQKVSMPFTLAQTTVMQELHVDVIGPMDADKWGYTHVLTVIDSFSRWLMAYPIQTTESEDILVALIEHIGIFGAPQRLRTDNGSSLTSKQVEAVLALLGTDHRLTVAYSHEENGIIENANRKIIGFLRAMVFDASVRDNWSMLLPFAQRICNAEVVSSLGVKPAQLLFGNALDLDRAILKPNIAVSKHDHEEMSEYVKNLIAAQKKVVEYAKTTQEIKDSAHLSSGQGSRLDEYGDGTLVTVSYPQNMSGKSKPPDKLLTQRKGPYEVVEHTGSTYKLRHVADNKVIHRHISQLELFYYDPDSVDPMEVAAKDLKEFIVEEILDHDPKRQPSRNRKHLNFW